MTGFAGSYKGEIIGAVLCVREAEMPENCSE